MDMLVVFLVILLVACFAYWKRRRLPVAVDGSYAVRQSRLYSGFKRLHVALLGMHVFLILVVVTIHLQSELWFLPKWTPYAGCAVAILAFVSGIVFPRTYHDGRIRDGAFRLICMAMLGVLLSMTCLVGYGMAGLMLNIGVSFKTDTPTFDLEEFRRIHAEHLAPRLIPPEARHISITLWPETVWRGERALIRCSCTRAELQAFADKHGYALQSESMSKNVCPDNPEEVQSVEWMIRYYRHGESEEAMFPKSFLAYNFRDATGSGVSFLYDMETQFLYGEWVEK